jgi:hypothetical protein
MRFLQLTLEVMKELFGIMHVRDDEVVVPNTQRMCIGEEEFSLSLPVTVVARGRGRSSPAAGPSYHSPARGRSPTGPPIMVRSCQRKKSCRAPYRDPTGGRGGHSPVGPPIMVPSERRGCLVTIDDNGPDDEGPVLPLVSSSPFFFSQKYRRFFSPFFLINAVDL